MGSLSIPSDGLVYVDAQVVIYSTDRHPVYASICDPVWLSSGSAEVVSSELILVETLVGPIKSGDKLLGERREAIWRQPNTRLLPITQEVLREAARLRASVGLKTPDAIHAATALLYRCSLFVTNDLGFKRVPGLEIAILDEVNAS